MKIRIFQNMCDRVFRIVVNTEDWSQEELKLMRQYGEPEIDVGGEIDYVYDGSAKTANMGSNLVRILHGFPFSAGFDSRDYGSYEEALAVGSAWKTCVLDRIRNALVDLRNNPSVIPTEEVTEI